MKTIEFLNTHGLDAIRAHKDGIGVLEKFNQHDDNLRHDFMLRNLRKLGKFID